MKVTFILGAALLIMPFLRRQLGGTAPLGPRRGGRERNPRAVRSIRASRLARCRPSRPIVVPSQFTPYSAADVSLDR